MCDPQFDRKSTSFIFVCRYQRAEKIKIVSNKALSLKSERGKSTFADRPFLQDEDFVFS